MPWNGSGTYTRGYPSWGNDANNGLPISSTKLDLEDNDFAAGIQNCLTIDGQNKPNGAIIWTLPSAQVLALNRGSDGSVLSVGRVSGSNNPAITIQFTDATGGNIGLTTAQQLSLSVNAVSRIATVAAGSTTISGVASSSSLVVASALGAATGTTDMFVNRAGSTANALSQGPSLQLQDTTNATSTLFQQSGGQTEQWQLNGGTWRQIWTIGASDFNLRTRDDGGTQQVVGYRDLPPNIINSNYAVVHADRGKVIQCNANNLVITFPNDSTFPVGSTIVVDTGGATGTTIAAAASASILWYNGTGTVGTRSISSFSLVTVMYHNTSSGSNWAITGAGIS